MAEDLGTAVLRVTVDSREALSALQTLRENIGQGFGNPGAGLFRGIEEQARAAGTRAGRALRDAISSIGQGLNFQNIGEALDFQGALNGSIRDLRQYREALVSLRDGTSAATPGFSELNDVIAEVGRTLRNFSASSDDLVADLQRHRQAARSPELAQLADLYRNLERTSANAARGQAQLTRSQQGVRAVGDAAQQANPAVRQLRELLASLQGAGTSFDARNLRQISDEAAASGLSVQQFTRAVLNGQTPLTKTTAGLQQQARAFQTLAAFTEAGTAEFNNFTQAAAKASQRQLFVGFKELTALRQQFQVGRAPQPERGINNDSFRGTEELLEFARRVEQTPAAINLYIQALQQAQSVTLTTDENFGRLTAEIDRQRAAFAAATQTANAYAAVLRLTEDQRRAVAQSFRDAANVNRPLALPSSELLAQRVQLDGGRQPQRLSLTEPNLVNNAGFQAARDFTQGLLDSARAANTLEQEASQLAATLQVLRRGAELRRPALPPSQQFVFDPNAPEDPGVLRAEERNRRRREKIAGITDYANTGGRDNLAGVVPRNAAVIGANKEAIAKERELREGRRKTAQETARATQREAGKRRKQRSDAIGSGLIGGAFPLLFGQGLGASVGGGLGGVAGGLLGGQFGFGLSLVGTAIGSQIDALTKRFIALGEALRDPIANLDQFIQEATLASKSQEALVKALAETGQTQAAADLIRSEASRTLDPIAAEGAAAAQDAFNRTLSDFSDVLGTIVAGPARGFLDFLTGTLRAVTGTPPVVGDDPAANSLRSQQSARNRFGLSVGGAVAGAGLLVGGGLLLASGVGAPIGASVLGSGATLLAAGTAGAGVAASDAAVASSTLKSEQEIRAVKQDQLALERQILQAKAAGKAGLSEQLSVQAQFNALKVQELEQTQRIRVQLARNLLSPGGSDTEDRAAAQQQEADLKRAIEARRQALLDTAKAAEAGAAKELRNARELVGTYGTQRDILVEQQRIRAAETAADDAQKVLNQQRDQGVTGKPLETQERTVNRLIQERIAVELQGQDRIRQLEAQRWADSIAAANRVRQIQEETAIQAARPQLTGIGVGALQSLAQFRAAQDAEREAQARQRIAPGDPALKEAAQQAAENVKRAAAQTKSDLKEAFQAAQDSVRAISRSIEDGVLALQNLQNERTGGLNRFLSAQQVTDRQQKVNQELTTEAQRLAGQLGQRGTQVNFTPTGTLEQRNRVLADFIAAARTELRAGEDLNRQSIDLVRANNDLAIVNQALAATGTQVAQVLPLVQSALEALAGKDWSVNVNVAADGSATASGDVLNRALT